MSAPPPRLSQHRALGIEQIGKRRIPPGLGQRGVVELMPTQRRAGATERTILEECSPAVTEMQAALGEARHLAEQAGHGVTFALGVDERLAKHHVAAALTMHRPCRGEAREAVFEAGGIGKRPGV